MFRVVSYLPESQVLDDGRHFLGFAVVEVEDAALPTRARVPLRRERRRHRLLVAALARRRGGLAVGRVLACGRGSQRRRAEQEQVVNA